MLFQSSWHRSVLAVLGGLGIGLAHADAPLILPEVLHRVLARHPGLTTAVSQHTTALGREIQVNRMPSPATFSLSQRVEPGIGLVRTERSAVAAAESPLADGNNQGVTS